MRGVIVVLAAALAGCAVEESVPARPIVLAAPDATPSNAVKVRVAVKDRQVRITAEAGVKEVDFSDTAAQVDLAGGQRLVVDFDAGNNSFHVEVREDADGPIDVVIGATVIQVTKGDIVDATVTRKDPDVDLDVAVVQGVVHVTGPNGRGQDIAPKSQLLVAGGGVGAIYGVPPPVSPLRFGQKRVPREPRRPPILDRTDINPAP
jgi:hypothetical protein